MKLISAFVFTTQIVQFLFYLNPKFQASSSFLCLYRPVCVGLVWKPHCWFSHEVAQTYLFLCVFPGPPQVCLCQHWCLSVDCRTVHDNSQIGAHPTNRFISIFFNFNLISLFFSLIYNQNEGIQSLKYAKFTNRRTGHPVI